MTTTPDTEAAAPEAAAEPPPAPQEATGAELVPVDHDPGAVSSAMDSIGLPSPYEWAALQAMSERMARSNLVPSALRGKPDDILLVLLTGRDLRIGPTVALSKVHVIDGKPTLAAELMSGLVNRRPGMRIWPKPGNNRSQATACARREGDYMEFTFTIDDAVDADLVYIDQQTGRPKALDSKNKPMPWEKYTQFMLWSRAVSGLCRMAFSDVLAGVTYTPEELGAEVDGDGNIITVESYLRGGDDDRGGDGNTGGGARTQTPDEAAQSYGWRDEAHRLEGREDLRKLAADMGPEVSARVKAWRAANDISISRADGWVRTVAAFHFFAAEVAAEAEAGRPFTDPPAQPEGGDVTVAPAPPQEAQGVTAGPEGVLPLDGGDAGSPAPTAAELITQADRRLIAANKAPVSSLRKDALVALCRTLHLSQSGTVDELRLRVARHVMSVAEGS